MVDHNLNENEVEYLTELFGTFDAKTEDGKLSVHEFKELTASFGFKYEDEVIGAMFTDFDKDKSGKLGLDEFIQIFAKRPRTDIKEANTERVFKSMDVDGSGFVTPGEIKEVLAKQKINVSDAELEDMMNKIDKDGDGKLKVEEFKKLWDEFSS